MSWTGSGLAVVCALAMGLASPVPAHASGDWEWPVDGTVAVGYGARYASEQGVACTHGGVDIGAPGGSTIRACVAGEVTFSGLVPAGEGERAWAVTVLTADGLRVTYLPLSRASASKGADVGSGDPLGELAATGDASSPTPHLHLGVRRGETKLDPLAFLGERAAAPRTSPSPQAPPPAESVAPAAPVAHGAASAAPQSAHAPANAAVHASIPVASGEPAEALSALLPGALPAALPAMPRVPQVAETPRVRSDVVAADLGSVREVASIALVCLGLAGLAGACVWPVLRGVLDGSAASAPAVAPARSDHA
jgi:Peptidase family M23